MGNSLKKRLRNLKERQAAFDRIKSDKARKAMKRPGSMNLRKQI